VQVIRVLKANAAGVTRVQEPPPIAGIGVPPTINGSPLTPPPLDGVSDTVIQGPHLHSGTGAPVGVPTYGLATTAPDQAVPTIIDQGQQPFPPPAPLPGERPPRNQSLTYIVLGMAGVIGLLLALLLWALFFRG
jgi:hypothetical protein